MQQYCWLGPPDESGDESDDAWERARDTAVPGVFFEAEANAESSEEDEALGNETRVPVDVDGRETHFRLCQAPSAYNGLGGDETGGVLWGAAVVLAEVVSGMIARNEVTGTFLELGCGCALASLAARQAGADDEVVATDGSKRAVARAKKNAKLNSLRVTCQVLKWGSARVAKAKRSRYDVVMASDAVYTKECVEPLVETIERHARGVVLVSCRDGRPGVESFVAAMNASFDLMRELKCPPRRTNSVSTTLAVSHTVYKWRRKARKRGAESDPDMVSPLENWNDAPAPHWWELDEEPNPSRTTQCR